MENPAPVQPNPNPPPQKPKRNWKKISLILLIGLFLISLVGVGLYLLIPRLAEQPDSPTQNQATPSSKPKKSSPLKNKIIFTKTITTNQKYTAPWGVELTKSDSDIYIMNADGTGETKIFDFDPSDSTNYVSQISLSPKGNYLGWLKYSDNNNTSIQYTSVSDKTKKSATTLLSTKGIRGFAFSPNEKQVAVLIGSKNPPNLKGAITSVTIRIYQVDTKTLIKEFETVAGSGKENERINVSRNSIAWLNDNKIITFGRNQNGTYLASYSIKDGLSSENRITKPSKNLVQVIGINSSKNKIAYPVINSKEGNYENSSQEIWLANVDGSNKKMVTKFSLGSSIRSLEFAPDGNWLAIPTNNAEATEFHLVNLVENKVVKTNLPFLSAVWSPKSDSLVVDNGVYANKITLIGLDGKPTKDLTSLSEQSNKQGTVSRYGLVEWVR